MIIYNSYGSRGTGPNSPGPRSESAHCADPVGQDRASGGARLGWRHPPNSWLCLIYVMYMCDIYIYIHCIMFICTYMIIILCEMYGHHFWRSSSPGRGGPDGGHGDAAEGEGGLRAKFPGAEGHHRPGAQGRSMAQHGAAALLKEIMNWASHMKYCKR